MEIFYEGSALVETLQTFLTAALALAAVAALEKPTLARWLGAGALVGVSALARQNALLFAPLLAALAFTPLVVAPPPAPARRAALAAALLAGAALLVLPATLRNWAVSGDVVLVNSTGGILMYTGWNPEARAFTVPRCAARAWTTIEQDATAGWPSSAGRAPAPPGLGHWRSRRCASPSSRRARAARSWKARLF
jgi:hypothetical protein